MAGRYPRCRALAACAKVSWGRRAENPDLARTLAAAEILLVVQCCLTLRLLQANIWDEGLQDGDIYPLGGGSNGTSTTSDFPTSVVKESHDMIQPS